jgi:hypothetical protein
MSKPTTEELAEQFREKTDYWRSANDLHYAIMACTTHSRSPDIFDWVDDWFFSKPVWFQMGWQAEMTRLAKRSDTDRMEDMRRNLRLQARRETNRD